MIGAGWQDYAVAGIAVAALTWLVARRVRRRRMPTPLCEGCPGCAAAESPPRRPGGDGLELSVRPAAATSAPRCSDPR
ncbi:MAG: hypothetical protein HZB25_14410 [Candidatus Eisenbacteria bacterium]|nr:hypothetical protein [Candidatus Eisenbacteria bacterium]